jgi:hypothetical protein
MDSLAPIKPHQERKYWCY